MTIVADLKAETRRHLQGASRSELNSLASDLTVTGTSLVLSREAVGVARGSVLGVGDELLYVWSYDSANKTATVLRGHLGTTAVAHASGVPIEVNPRFSTFDIGHALKREIAAWTHEVFATSTVSVEGADHLFALDLSGAYFPLAVVGKPQGGRWTKVSGWSVIRGLPTDDVAEGAAISVTDPRFYGSKLTVTLAVPFDTSTFDDDTVVETAVGLPTSMLDVAALGAAARLLETREVARTSATAQGEPRHAEEVPPGHLSQTGQLLRRRVDVRLSEEAARLRAAWPYRGG